MLLVLIKPQDFIAPVTAQYFTDGKCTGTALSTTTMQPPLGRTQLLANFYTVVQERNEEEL